MKRIDLYLTAPQVKKLKKLAKKMGSTMSELMRRAIDKFLDNQK